MDISAIATQLEVDNSFFVLFGSVWASYFLLSFLFFRPFKNLILKRRELSVGSIQGSEELEARSKKVSQDYEDRLKAARQQATEILNSAREAAKKTEAQEQASANEKCRDMIQSAIKELEGSKKQVLASIKPEIPALSRHVVEKLLSVGVKGRG